MFFDWILLASLDPICRVGSNDSPKYEEGNFTLLYACVPPTPTCILSSITTVKNKDKKSRATFQCLFVNSHYSVCPRCHSSFFQKAATGESALDMAPLAAVLCGKEPRLVEYMTKSLLPRIQSQYTLICLELNKDRFHRNLVDICDR